VLPLRDHNPTHRTPVVTIALIAVNVGIFLTEPLTGTDAQQTRFFFCNATLPYEVVNRELAPQVPYGALGCPGKSVLLAMLYSMFLHGGLLHIGGNMLFLWVFGNNVEDRLGRVRFLAFYLLAGAAATMAQSYLTPASVVPLIGASGAIAGVLGAYLLMFPHAQVTTLIFYFVTELPAVLVLAGWFLLQVFQGVGSVQGDGGGVAYFAHIGGFIAGMILLLLLRPRPPSRPQTPIGPVASR